MGVLKSLVSLNQNLINQIDLKGHTPLSLSIELQKYRISKFLIWNGADVQKGGGLRSSNLHLAALA